MSFKWFNKYEAQLESAEFRAVERYFRDADRDEKECPLLGCTKCSFQDVLIQGIFAVCPKCGGKLHFIKMVKLERV